MNLYKTPLTRELLETMDRFRAKDHVRKSSTHFVILGMEACRLCGHKADYREGPPETITICRCRYEQLKQRCVKESPAAFGQMERYFGMAIEVMEPAQ